MQENSNQGPKFVYFGSEGISITVLDKMVEAGFVPSLIVAQPDKPKGRKLVPTPPAIIDWAREHSIAVIQPEDLRSEVPEELKADFDVFVVVSYGKIIPKEILDLPERGSLNVHPSLLPQLRGPSPIQTAILEDVKETGTTIMLLDEEMDHGPIIAQAAVSPEPWPLKASELEDMLAQVSGDLLVDIFLPWINGDIQAEEQDHDNATYCEYVKKEHAEINLDDDPYQNYLKIQAYDIWPIAFFFVEKMDKKTYLPTGKVRVKITEVSYKNNALVIERVIPEGKKEMDYEDFKRGLR